MMNETAVTKPPAGESKETVEARYNRHSRQLLFLLHHSFKCPHEEGQCTVTKHCSKMKEVWKHIALCNEKKCEVPHCISSRWILHHYHKCKDKSCPVCAPVKEEILQQQDWKRAMKELEEFCGSSELSLDCLN